MKNVSLSGSSRENVGKKDAKALRAVERVPCVLYGGENQIHFSVDYVELSKIVFTGDVFQIDLDLDGVKVPSVIKEVQFHPVSDKVIHVDFIELLEDKSIKIKLPVHVSGLAIGVKNGGRLMIPYRKLTIKGRPSALPDDIEIDISKLRIGEKIRVSEIKLEGAKILEPQDTVVVLIKTARNIIEEEEEEGEEGEEGTEGAEDGEKTEAPAEN
jgi:large subunit ribosomal protein L25